MTERTEQDSARERLLKLCAEAEGMLQGSEVTIDDSLTTSYPWGWVFHFVPTDPAKRVGMRKQSCYAYDKVTGEAYPIGTKGLGSALKVLASFRDESVHERLEWRDEWIE